VRLCGLRRGASSSSFGEPSRVAVTGVGPRGYNGAAMRYTPHTIRALVPAVDHPYRSSLVFQRVFTPRQCRRIVDLGLSLTTEEALVGAQEEHHVEDGATRISRTAWIEASEDNLWMFDKLARVAERANRTYGFDLLGFTEDIQFTRYDVPGAFYDWHQDGLEGEVAVRKLSMVLQLTDPDEYDGGDLQLFNVEEDWDEEDQEIWRSEASRQGSVIAFPAFEYHRVQPITRGKRYSAVCWIGGPPFR
jgi:PKHD-type hydroxylase